MAEMVEGFLAPVAGSGRHTAGIVLGDFRDSEDAMSVGVAATRGMAATLLTQRRRAFGLDALRLAIRSSAGSGSSQRLVNPLVGRLVESVAAVRGSVVFTELADLAAVTDEVVARAVSEEIAQRARRAFDEIATVLAGLGDAAPDPTPINRAAGLATLGAKGRGALQRLGGAPRQSVVAYGDTPGRGGLHMMTGPGSAAVSLIGLAAAGCAIAVYTVGTLSAVPP